MLPEYSFQMTLSATFPDPVPAGGARLLLFTDTGSLDNHTFPSMLRAKILRCLEEKKEEAWIVYGEENWLIAVSVNPETESKRVLGASVYTLMEKENLRSLSAEGLEAWSMEERYAFIEGMVLCSYRFDKYKKERKEYTAVAYFPDAVLPAAMLEELNHLLRGIALTRDLVNEPVNHLDAVQLSRFIEAAGGEFGFETEIFHKEEIERFGMGGLLAVNRGSETPPTFNVLKYKPANAVNPKPLVLVGKGVTFDTGGYSLKVGGVMSNMKSDMAGGGAVLGILSAIAASRLPYYVVGLIPATDNKISANALVVDDIITMMDGTTVEIQNTDAEGRLILADALAYARQFDPELVIDMATLTGAASAITGPFGIAMAGNDPAAMEKLAESGDKVYERLFRLPFWKEYRELLKSEVADLKNIGGPVGGASTAGKFLEHFTAYPWIHLDIAGVAFSKESKAYRKTGATAVPVRLLYDFIKKQCPSLPG